MQRQRLSGFTLVELSIVLVILGLLVGGVLAGQSLIRASELRAFITERDKFSTATYAFRDKYFALPGDKADAYRFWGATCGTDTTDASAGCNGDGDGIVETANGESIKVWEHLTQGALLEGSFDGTGTVVNASGDDRVIPSRTNTPKSKFPQAHWLLNDCTTTTIPGTPSQGLCLSVGGIGNNSYLTAIPTLTNGETYNVDKKVDDGFSASGKMRGNFSLEDPNLPVSFHFSIISEAYALEQYRNYCSDWATTDAYSIEKFGEDHSDQCSLNFVLQ